MTGTRYARCGRKQRYATREDALAGQQQWAERTGRPALLLLVSAYECPYCHSFHLGRSKANRKRYVAHVLRQKEEAPHSPVSSGGD